MAEPIRAEDGEPRRGRSRWSSGYGRIALVVVAVLLGLFVLAEALSLPVLTDPVPWLDEGGPVAALVGVGLLVADVAVPAPSSVIMVAHGALFGVVGGAALSLVGALGATLVAFLVGRRGREFVRRRTDPEERGRVRRLVDRYGVVAIVASRPVPIVAETVALLAGTTAMRWRTALLGGVVGNVVPALVYAYAGSRAVTVADQALILGGVIVLSFVLLLVGRRLSADDVAGRG